MKIRTAFVLLLAALLLAGGCAANRRQAGTGDVAFRLTWEGISDLDLEVRDPSGACISFVKRQSPSGGVLDVDCNAGTGFLCEHPIENVFWPPRTAAPGDYMFWVSAHSLIPAESPLPFRLQVLLGKEVFWLNPGSVRETNDTYGPFVYSFPSGKIAGPLAGTDPSLTNCSDGVFFLPAPEAEPTR